MTHRYCGREFTASELALIRQLIAENPTRTRSELSRLTCLAFNWFKVDGGLKAMSARVALLRMQIASLQRIYRPLPLSWL
jgi:hypothetical protein